MHVAKEKAGRRTTIYRLTGVSDFQSAIRNKYLDRDDFAHQEVDVGGRLGYMVTGAMVKDRADWCSAIAALTGQEVEIGGVTPAGVLLVRSQTEDALNQGVAYALSYGMGFQLLEQGRLDNLFGQRIAIRTADPQKLRSLTVTTMDERSRTSRATIPQGDGLLGFGVGDVGEAVSRIVAVAKLPMLSRSAGEPLQIRGADALNIPLGNTPTEVLSDLDALEALLATEPHPSLKLLEQLAAVRNPETKERLDAVLSKALDGDSGNIGLSWPHERVDENGTPDSWVPRRLWPGRNNAVQSGQPDWNDIRAVLEEFPVGQRLARVDSATIQLCRDSEGKEPISQAIPLRRWLAFETDLDDRTYALYDGSWYEVHHDYVGNITQRVKDLFDGRVTDLKFPTWAPEDDEDTYNRALADALGGVCLDKKLIKTDLHGRGIEACDVYLTDGTLIHVKKTEKSAAASHLLAQALVSADALCGDAQARKKLKDRIEALGGDASNIGSKPKRVVLAMYRGSGKPVNARTLFTFTKVNLVRQATTLEERGVPVYVVSIDGPVD
ncbi:DUF6119 family protein [Agrococcus sp. KRD186]|uniref:DUF6119 family protein n=1 Tax=Agrococcus sp. KRD186 TaxID=2729730 RepID=UPI001F496339|nr:DUF6119 family protein [Agrococcus sp. KRD186]